MNWQLFCLTYELLSPLHIGYHKVGNVQRTRYHLPARNLWGAVTERLTRGGFQGQNVPQGDYQKIGKWVKDHCRFSCFFVSEGNSVLAPCYKSDGLYYGSLTQAEFQRRYLDSHVTTAVDAATTSAAEGSLHEVEFVSPYPAGAKNMSEHTCLTGWVFLKDEARNILGTEQRWRAWLGDLHVGGERRYGFGRLRILSLKEDSTLDGLPVQTDLPSPRVYFQTNDTLFAHILAQGIYARGTVEPVVGRETSCSHAFGFNLTQGMVYWAPGSVLTASVRGQLEHEGYFNCSGGCCVRLDKE